MEPAAVVLTAYVLLAFVLSLWACFRGSGNLFAAGAVVWFFWCLGMIVQFRNGLEPPAWAYLLMDVCAVAWFVTSPGWSRLFGLTFAAQVALHSARLMGWLDPWPYWWWHCWSGFTQLAVLLAWIISARSGSGVRADRSEPSAAPSPSEAWRNLR